MVNIRWIISSSVLVSSSSALMRNNRLAAMNKCTTIRMSSNDVPMTIQGSWKQSMRTAINAGLTTSAVVGLASLANADTEVLPAVVTATAADSFMTTESGLKYRDTNVGDGELPSPGDTVRVHYTGWLDDFGDENGVKFDSSYDRRSPLVFKVGVKQVIAGWDEALLTNMKVGGKRDIIIPSQLGYGKRGAGGVIPPDATLYFKIELVGIGNKANR